MGVSYQKVLDKLDEHGRTLEEIKQCGRENTARIRELERWQSYIMGGLTILAILVIPLAIQAIEVWARG